MFEIGETFLKKPAPPAKPGTPHMSIELAPEQVRTFNPNSEQFPLGSRIFLTHLNGKPDALQVEAALRITEMGYVAVPHLGARNFKTEKDFIDLVMAHSHNEITEALFLGGNSALFPGPMAEAAQLLAHPVVRDSNIQTAFIAGYPEGHSSIIDAKLADAFRRKLEICDDHSLNARVVSQFAFDGAVIGAWAQKLHAAHPGVPVHVGLAGVTSLTKLVRFAMMCGVGASLAALKRSAGSLFNVIADRNPADVLEEIAAKYPEQAGSLHLHFFPFGGWEKTLAWYSEYRDAGPQRPTGQ